MAARHEQCRKRRHGVGMLERGREQMRLEVMHRYERSVERERQRFGVQTPTSSAPMRPGVYVTATASTSVVARPASWIARSTTGTMLVRWMRDAISGTTPPKTVCASCDRITSDRSATAAPVPATIAADVSSHDVSTPSTRTGLLSASDRRTGSLQACSRSCPVGARALTRPRKETCRKERGDTREGERSTRADPAGDRLGVGNAMRRPSRDPPPHGVGGEPATWVYNQSAMARNTATAL